MAERVLYRDDDFLVSWVLSPKHHGPGGRGACHRRMASTPERKRPRTNSRQRTESDESVAPLLAQEFLLEHKAPALGLLALSKALNASTRHR